MNPQRTINQLLTGAFVCSLMCAGAAFGQLRTASYQANRDSGSVRAATAWASRSADSTSGEHVREIQAVRKTLSVRQHHSQLIVAKKKIARIAVTSPDVANFVQYSETELAVIGLKAGSTDLTFWFDGNPTPVIYDIEVTAPIKQTSNQAVITELGNRLSTVFPRSRVQLIPVADQIVVKGQAWDTDEAAAIMKLLNSQFGSKSRAVINMLRVPGEFQVLLKARIAELNRQQMRRLGVDCRKLLSRGAQASGFGPTSAGVSGVFTKQQTDKLMQWMVSNGTISYLAEPSLTVLSGHTGSLLSGGEFAVKTTGVNGNTHTEFRKYGTSLKVTPTVVDRDLIRLHLTPEFSQLNDQTVDGIPGKNVRRIDTVVELREGQTIAIGGLVAKQMLAEQTRRSGIRDLFTRRNAVESETELLIIVTPELVRPMDASEVPPLPNHYVTPPNDCELEAGLTEGRTDTVSPLADFSIQPLDAPTYQYQPTSAEAARAAETPALPMTPPTPRDVGQRTPKPQISPGAIGKPGFKPDRSDSPPVTSPRTSSSQSPKASEQPFAPRVSAPKNLKKSQEASGSRSSLPLVRPMATNPNTAGRSDKKSPSGTFTEAVKADSQLARLPDKPVSSGRISVRKRPGRGPIVGNVRSMPTSSDGDTLLIRPSKPATQLPRIGGHSVPPGSLKVRLVPPARQPISTKPQRASQSALPGIGHTIP